MYGLAALRVQNSPANKNTVTVIDTVSDLERMVRFGIWSPSFSKQFTAVLFLHYDTLLCSRDDRGVPVLPVFFY
jgi:hypothetical protein